MIPGENADVAASAVVRIAVCHYLVQGGTPEEFLAELRHAAGLDPVTAGCRDAAADRLSGSARRRSPPHRVGLLQVQEMPHAVE